MRVSYWRAYSVASMRRRSISSSSRRFMRSSSLLRLSAWIVFGHWEILAFDFSCSSYLSLTLIWSSSQSSPPLIADCWKLYPKVFVVHCARILYSSSSVITAVFFPSCCSAVEDVLLPGLNLESVFEWRDWASCAPESRRTAEWRELVLPPSTLELLDLTDTDILLASFNLYIRINYLKIKI